MLPHLVRVDGCMCGMREPTQGDSMWKPLGIKSNSAQVKTWFRGLRRSHPNRHEVCPEDSERNRYPRLLAGRAARGIMQNTRLRKLSVG